MANRGNRNNNPIVEERRQKVAALINRGITSDAELARILKISPRTAARDKGAVHARMVATADERFRKVYRGQQLSRIRMLIKENSAAWEASKRPTEVIVEQTVTNQDGTITMTRETRREGCVGKVAFLREIRELLKREAALLGLDAPPAVQQRSEDSNAATSTAMLMRLADSLATAQIVDRPHISQPAMPTPDAEATIVVDVPLPRDGGDGRDPHGSPADGAGMAPAAAVPADSGLENGAEIAGQHVTPQVDGPAAYTDEDDATERDSAAEENGALEPQLAARLFGPQPSRGSRFGSL
jgi:hypothetical protein